MVGLEIRFADGSPATPLVLWLVKSMLRQSYVLLPEGNDAQVLAFTPPLTITENQLNRAVSALQTLLESVPKSNWSAGERRSKRC